MWSILAILPSNAFTPGSCSLGPLAITYLLEGDGKRGFHLLLSYRTLLPGPLPDSVPPDDPNPKFLHLICVPFLGCGKDCPSGQLGSSNEGEESMSGDGRVHRGQREIS